MNNVVALVLAAGKGTRMYSDLAKVLHPIDGRPMLSYTLAALESLKLDRMLVVVGHQADRIKKVFAEYHVEWVLQAEQLGTGHAVLCALSQLADFDGSVLICCGDTPLRTQKPSQSLTGEQRCVTAANKN
jgi:bifunctional N-acetylglucosamine-1-phosphate-uridyltransferase/glucosamine-1-phosphate-acetyltransferase GlmU-like protein